jgi:SOS-response transcriptional repressor LexA
MLKISEISSENERDYWLRLAGVDPPALEQSLKGYKQTSSYVEGDMLIVPIRSGAIAAGQPLSMDIEEYEGRIGIPLAEAAETGCFIAARVKGNSMAPRIMEGYLVVIDSRRRPPKDNVGQIVAAADEQGDMTIKILGQNRGGFFLVAGNPDFEPHIQNIDVSNKWAIFGRVVKWIGQLDRKRK